MPPQLDWQLGTVERVTDETYRTKTFSISLPAWRTFRPGQHVDVRLTASDGYQAQRSYSIASAPGRTGIIDLTVELVTEGEVSSYFHEVARAGDQIEVRGPIGGPFTWSVDMGGPLLLVAGGSGIVPLMSMLRHRRDAALDIQALLLYSSRAQRDVIYRDELEREDRADPRLSVVHTLTREQPDEWQSFVRRVDRPMLEDVLRRLDGKPWSYACGPTPFVEVVARALVDLGVPPDRVRTERFGPSGGGGE